MANRIRCACQSCTIRSLMGPAVVITLGLLFLFSEMRGGYFDFSNTWPVLLLVIGAILLASALAPRDGHASGSVPPAAPAGTPGAPQNQFPGQGQ
jgi:ABC-type Fe3+ transport system permease subunit